MALLTVLLTVLKLATSGFMVGEYTGLIHYGLYMAYVVTCTVSATFLSEQAGTW